MKWEKVSLENISTRIGDGLHGTPKYDESGEFYFINGNNLADGKIILKEDTKRISSIEYDKIKKELNDRTVLIAINGTLGNIGMYRDEPVALGKSACYINVNEKAEKLFIRYVLANQDFQIYARDFATGSTIKNLGLKAVRDYSFNLPPLLTQRKISSILSAYDDLIENNLKRIKLLEEKAQMHYKELMLDSAKWDKVRLESFVSVVKGRKPANVLEQPEEESQLYLLLDTVERGKTLYTTDLSLPQSKITDVLMCMDGARSGLSFRGMVGAIGSTMAIWRSNSERISGEFLYQFMKQNESAITQGNTGAAIPHANRKFILDMKMAMPPKKEAEYFDSLTLPTIKLINTMHQQNAKLREARDILLPRLMSGQIEI
jgi:type I restriction enzyme S subunit